MMSARLSVATGQHLAEHMRLQYPRGPRYAHWLLIELAIVACDMIEVVGGAVALSTLSGGQVPLWAGVLITAASAFAALCLERAGMRALEALLLTLILVVGGTFGYCFFTVGVDYVAVLKGLAVPTLGGDSVQYAVGAIGAIIMPHNLYLHSALILTRCAAARRGGLGLGWGCGGAGGWGAGGGWGAAPEFSQKLGWDARCSGKALPPCPRRLLPLPPAY